MGKGLRQGGSLLFTAALVLLTARGQNAATADTASAPDAAAIETTNTANETAAPAVVEAAPAKAQTATVTALPLKRGYYVASDTPCDQASNATTVLLRSEGIGGSRDFCDFTKIEKTGANTYRVTEACRDLQDSAPPETSINTYTLKGDTGFTSKSANGWEHSARYCAQSSMPPEWRKNDIGDVTG